VFGVLSPPYVEGSATTSAPSGPSWTRTLITGDRLRAKREERKAKREEADRGQLQLTVTNLQEALDAAYSYIRNLERRLQERDSDVRTLQQRLRQQGHPRRWR
jgi:hypothetical protein